MKSKKRTFTVIVLIITVMQFIRPAKNITTESSGNEMSKQFTIPSEVQTILKTSCYDCHSNNTRYPWYSWIQPVGWWLANHIKNAKKELNFDEFASYSPKRQYHKFDKMEDEVSEKEMPLTSYTLIHRDAVLSEDQIKLFTGWTMDIRKEMEMKYPAESLINHDSEKEHDD